MLQIDARWVLNAGDSLSFLARDGRWTLHAVTGLGARFELTRIASAVRTWLRA